MSEELIPEDGTEIILTTEDSGASETISSTLASVDSWSWSFDGTGEAPDDPKELVGTDQGDTLLIEYEPSPDLFPLQYLDYLDADRNRLRIEGVDAFDQLPDPQDAPEVVEMREDDKDQLIWSVPVTATGLDGDGEPATASATYTIRVQANYNLSRDKLSEAVDARR